MPGRYVAFLRGVSGEDARAEARFRARRVRGPSGTKRVVTFLREKPAQLPPLPVTFDGARILEVVGSEVLSAYVPSPRGPAFMALLEKTFGKDITTRTWETVQKVSR